jgi:hypothetical protein
MGNPIVTVDSKKKSYFAQWFFPKQANLHRVY